MAVRVFLDVDVSGHRAAHARAQAFVEATNLRYGWSSKRLDELGGSERARIHEIYESDHEWGSRGRLELEPCPHERLEFTL